MSEVVKFPKRDPKAPDQRLWTADEIARRGTATLNIWALEKWLFNPLDAAYLCATAKDRDAALEYWRGHIEKFRAVLRARKVPHADIERLRLEYTQHVRIKIGEVRSQRLTLQDWKMERVASMAMQCEAEIKVRDA
jgi:hypothetical protein